MKIGILTHPLETNYGGILQAFALQKTLRSLGHEAITINRHNHEQYYSTTHQLMSFGKRIWEFYIKQKNVSPRWNPFLTRTELDIITKNLQSFISNNIVTTEWCYSEDLSRIDDIYQFDAYVVGSDQVWMPGYCLNSFLDFVKRDNVIKIAYAASSGSTSFVNNPFLLKQCKYLAKDFKALSARESSLAHLVQEGLDTIVSVVLDPTLLIDTKDYLNAITTSNEVEPTIFSYILDKTAEKQVLLNRIAEKIRLPLVSGNVTKYYKPGGLYRIDECVYPSIDDWINNINRSKFVVTDSFHGTALAILFNKPFITIINNQRGRDRFLSLFEILQIPENRMLDTTNVSDLDNILTYDIDFTKINQAIMYQRCHSLEFLKKNLCHNDI